MAPQFGGTAGLPRNRKSEGILTAWRYVVSIALMVAGVVGGGCGWEEEYCDVDNTSVKQQNKAVLRIVRVATGELFVCYSQYQVLRF